MPSTAASGLASFVTSPTTSKASTSSTSASTIDGASFLTTPINTTSTTAPLTLPPQTTPFTPPADADCALSVYCPFLTYWLYTQGGHQLSGMPCQALNKLDASEPRQIGYRPECLPPGYYTLFDNLVTEMDPRIPGVPTESDGGSTRAYPGTACVSGWTTACTTTITAEINAGDGGAEGTYPQAWCCPPGGWECTATEAIGVPGRHCQSVMTEATNIWMTWDPPFTDLTRGEYYTYPAGVTSEAKENGATIYHRVFPLQLTMVATAEATAEGGGSGGSSDAQQTSSGIGDGDGDAIDSAAAPALSKGAVAGIAVGVVLLVMLLGAGAFILLYRRRRKKKGEENGVGSGSGGDGPESTSEYKPDALDPTLPPPPLLMTMTMTGGILGDKPELEGSSVQLPHVLPKAELEARTPPGYHNHLRPSSELDASGPVSHRGTVSTMTGGYMSPNPTGGDGIFPSPDSRYRSVFEMPG
ncbi:uncharacterized protein GGS25DRAFT_172956 [Hypoxylon fragiforme]|uniref:uncharacterized protein n=1 Tax=Hypoxylon fragiforme TaxID=63214 RepID=UPI0020C6029C|nr:uncharacterized protein GGS25DRAFT_172956 [Hypoxylon fragiforme]KAI2610928.1 hypothetical protein GGS25DRAFT_172956 [Hypoxylon fragiforme]